MKSTVTQVSIHKEGSSQVFSGIKVYPNDMGAGTFLIIEGLDEGEKVSLEWEEWDELVKVVSEYRKVWETE